VSRAPLPRFAVILVAILVFLLSAASPAFADAPDTATEATTLARDIDQKLALTTHADCADACRALASMRRSTDRLCAIEPGDRCDQARAKLHDAIERVRVSCPACETASPSPAPSPITAAPPSTGSGAAPSASDDARVASAQTTSVQTTKRGGCAGCTAASGTTPHGALALAGVAIALAITARRRKRRG
jgi:MYXO-CTERM domain-containing protein